MNSSQHFQQNRDVLLLLTIASYNFVRLTFFQCDAIVSIGTRTVNSNADVYIPRIPTNSRYFVVKSVIVLMQAIELNVAERLAWACLAAVK